MVKVKNIKLFNVNLFFNGTSLEEPPLPGQKSWKRPSSAADSERRLAESRRVAALGQTPSGSDGEKDRR